MAHRVAAQSVLHHVVNSQPPNPQNSLIIPQMYRSPKLCGEDQGSAHLRLHRFPHRVQSHAADTVLFGRSQLYAHRQLTGTDVRNRQMLQKGGSVRSILAI